MEVDGVVVVIVFVAMLRRVHFIGQLIRHVVCKIVGHWRIYLRGPTSLNVVKLVLAIKRVRVILQQVNVSSLFLGRLRHLCLELTKGLVKGKELRLA